MFKFNTEKSARGFRDRAIKGMGIILGDDGLFWVVTLATMDKLLKGGYEVI